MDEDRCIYLIISKLGSAYFVFVSTFYAMKEDLRIAYQKLTLESFCDALIREKDKLVQLGVINTTSTSNKSLVVHQKDKPKNPKKQNSRHNNKQHKGPKPTQTASLLMVTKDQNIKIRTPTDIANFVIKMVMMSPNVSRR
jgi:hypothetical protein